MFSPLNVVRYPFSVRAEFPSNTAAESRIHILAPWATEVGRCYTQAASPPDGTTAVNIRVHQSSFLNSLFSAYTGGVAGSMLPRFRIVRFCVEVHCYNAPLTTSGTFLALKIDQGIPLAVNSPAAGDYLALYNYVVNSETKHVIALSSTYHGRCIKTGTVDRTSLEFSGTPVGGWPDIYGPTAGTNSALGVGAGIPMAPIVLYISGTAAALPQYTLVMKGEYEFAPPDDNFLHPMSHKRFPSLKDSEARWWAMQAKLLLSGPSGAGVLDKGMTPARVPRIATTAPAPTPARPKRRSRPGARTVVSSAVAGLLAAGMAKRPQRQRVAAAIRGVMGRGRTDLRRLGRRARPARAPA